MTRPPASARPAIPDRIPRENAPHGGVGELLAAKDTEIARLRTENESLKRELRAEQALRTDGTLWMIRMLQRGEEVGR